MKYIQCPEIYTGKEKSIFIAGGITNCPDWQAKLVELLKDEKIVLINPRRDDFDASKSSIDEEQISWEFDHIEKADAVSFWFPKETLCPITLYELGKEISSGKQIFIGIHPEYKRKKDVEIQSKLANSKVKIVYSLKDLGKEVKSWARK
ncbi:MAG TPA: nucleoside 2-deoxyribosyltransferase domain-containing protein [Candidatus Nanoarchaeia archaeon]|nr:nucleoside 2-deoxyribosyltransferase domain-containing protein [Candidatus Nanoarchaeia archaeon]